MISLLFQSLPAPLHLPQPRATLVASTLAEVRASIRAADQAAKNGALVAGYVAYEAAPAFDPALHVRPAGDMPLAWFAIYDPGESDSAAYRTQSIALPEWQPAITRAEYDAGIAAIQVAIAAGETYQVNYTMRLRAQFAGESAVLFDRLWQAQPAPYAAFLDAGRFKILSLSPELFFHRRNGTITTKPMKGTAARGRWPEEDAAQATWLANSAKNQAENLMIVDLLRNDVGRVAEIGSVCVPELFQIERYPTVWQMTSTVTAQEQAGTTLEDVFVALFPCGSVTGAPKVNTMRLISTLETEPRGVYCGAIGVILPGGEAIFNVAIRTVVVDTERGEAVYGVGGGVVADSNPEDEYAETLAKAALLREQWPNFALLETLRLKNGRYALLEGHLQRLASSAAYFGVPFDLEQARAVLERASARESAGSSQERGRRGEGETSLQPAACSLPTLSHQSSALHNGQRIRLLVSRQGEIRIERTPLVPLPPGPQQVVLAATPVSRRDRFLFHKTTHRAVYETARALQPDVFDVLLWNEEGELTEFTIGNLVAEINGRRYTPPQTSGLLNGVLRSALVRRGTIVERVLVVADLRRASRVWLINSVRGWVQVELST